MLQAQENQSGQRECGRHLNILRHQQCPATVEPVCQHPSYKGEEHDGQLLQEGVEPKVKRRTRQGKDEPVLGDVLHPGANTGCTRPEPENPEITVAKRRQRPADSVCTGQGCCRGGGRWFSLCGAIQRCSGFTQEITLEFERTTPRRSIIFQCGFSAISSNAPIFLKSRNSSAFLNHLPEYVSGVGLRSGMRRASTLMKPRFSSSALYSTSESACTGTFSSVTQRSE